MQLLLIKDKESQVSFISGELVLLKTNDYFLSEGFRQFYTANLSVLRNTLRMLQDDNAVTINVDETDCLQYIEIVKSLIPESPVE